MELIIPSIFSSKRSCPKILFVASEAAPFARAGGLGEIMRSLPRALRGLGCDARVLIPKYGTINTGEYPMKMAVERIAYMPEASDPYGLYISNVLSHEDAEGGVTYFLENQEYFEKRANIYGYGDDPVRWALLSQSTLEFLRRSDWRPDIIVANDWQTGFIADFLKHQYAKDPILSKIATVFVIHNLYHQGMLDHRFVSESDFDSGEEPVPALNDPRLLSLNGMRRGIMWSDAISTVSPTYAKEILTPELGEGLNELLLEKRARLFGVLNAVDYEVFNPQTDRRIRYVYSRHSPGVRAKNKAVLQEKFNLKINPQKFIIGVVSRMDEQKGFDLLIQIAEPLFDNIDFQMVVVGGGDNKYRLFFQELEKKYPGRFGGHYFFDNILPALVFAGADVVLIPSRFEPSGLVQMEAMRYGAIPIVRRTGGLADSVTDFDGTKGDGFAFANFDPYGLFAAVIRAREEYNNKKSWDALVARAMQKDFSWTNSAKEYARIFKIAIANRNEMG